MVEVKKIKDKSEVEVLSQKNCQIVGKPTIYEGIFDDCLKDCDAYGKPAYYGSPKY